MNAPRSRAALVWRSLAAALWFAGWFFVVFPGLVLWASGASFPPYLGLGAALGTSVILLAHYALLQHMAAFIEVGGGTHAPFDPPRRLVLRGLYRRVRNPMYLIYLTIILGAGRSRSCANASARRGSTTRAACRAGGRGRPATERGRERPCRSRSAPAARPR